jgi:Holliday junction DNA helicase RuvA
MIAYLKGTLIEKSPQEAVINVGGVGYRVLITLNCYDALPQPGGTAEIHTLTISREDALHLYGFADREERVMFKKLVTVSRIGPKLACSILSGTKTEALRRAIVSQDKASFARIPGVGAKTAERIIMELKDKFAGEPAGIPLTGAEREMADAVAAMVNLGYKNADALKAVSEAAKNNSGADLAELIRKSLKILSQ